MKRNFASLYDRIWSMQLQLTITYINSIHTSFVYRLCNNPSCIFQKKSQTVKTTIIPVSKQFCKMLCTYILSKQTTHNDDDDDNKSKHKSIICCRKRQKTITAQVSLWRQKCSSLKMFSLNAIDDHRKFTKKTCAFTKLQITSLCTAWKYIKLSCRKEAVRCFMSLNILLSHSRSLKVVRNNPWV